MLLLIERESNIILWKGKKTIRKIIEIEIIKALKHFLEPRCRSNVSKHENIDGRTKKGYFLAQSGPPKFMVKINCPIVSLTRV